MPVNIELVKYLKNLEGIFSDKQTVEDTFYKNLEMCLENNICRPNT